MNKASIRKRSGGPKTEEGKKSSSRNALKTDAYSSLIILPGESEEDFKSLEEQFHLDFSPRDIAEATMVRNLAVLTWKKLRVEKLEHAALIRTLNGPFELHEYADLNISFRMIDKVSILSFIRQIDPEQQASWALAFQLATYYQKEGASSKELGGLQAKCSLLYNFYKDEANRVGAIDKNHQQWPEMLLKTPTGEEFGFISYISGKFLEEFQEQHWAIDHYDSLKASIVNVQEKRLLNFVRNGGAQRVYDDLDRAFYKTLSELCRHQQWRRDMSTQDVTPSQKDNA